MDVEGVRLSEICHTKKDKYHDFTYVWNLKKQTNEQINKKNQIYSREDKLMVATGKVGEEMSKMGEGECELQVFME